MQRKEEIRMTSPSITDDQLAQWDKLCEEATEGPWELFPKLCGPDGQTVMCPEGGPICEVGDPYPRSSNKPQENMELICASRTALPALLKDRKKLLAQLVTMREALELFRVQQLSTADTKRLFLRALDSSSDYTGKVVVDREEWEWMKAGMQELSARHISVAFSEGLRSRLDALRKQGGRR